MTTETLLLLQDHGRTAQGAHRPYVEENCDRSRAVPRWRHPVVESKGSYAEEQFLEMEIGGPLYESQDEIPLLPVLPIEETLARFLPTALPLARNPDERKNLLKSAASFPEEAKDLQKRLEARNTSLQNLYGRTSWFQEWWNTYGYLKVRDSVVISVSYFYEYADDPTTTNLIQRGAALMFNLARYRKLICSGQMEPETIGKAKIKIDATAFKYMFNTCRIPRLGQDSYRLYDPSRHSHCIVAVKGRFFAVTFCTSSGDPLPLGVLEERLQTCVDLASSRDPNTAELGYLTAANRDEWASSRVELFKLNQMPEALEKLESGAFVICLEVDEEPVSQVECARLFLHGHDGNRWFDKTLQIMVTQNGKAGLCGEHSLLDGMPTVHMSDFITKTSYGTLREQGSPTCCFPRGGVEDIFGPVMRKNLGSIERVQGMVEKAKQDLVKHIAEHSVHVQRVDGLGSSFIKQSGFSPDAFFQVGLQLAGYRLFGEQVGTYESTQVRTFCHGRTEVTRGVSEESAAFCERMGSCRSQVNDDLRDEKLRLMKEAILAHVRFMGLASKGKGVDRHLFGLSVLVREGEPTPALFDDPVFQRSKHWRMSTSHLTHPRMKNLGFGQVVPDGVGLSYSIHPDHLIVNVTALERQQYTVKLSVLLEEALLEMRDLILAVDKT